jgi:hypothetical protein
VKNGVGGLVEIRTRQLRGYTRWLCREGDSDTEGVSWGTLVIGDDFFDGARRQRDKLWVRIAVVRDDHYRLVEREAACPVPRVVVDVEGITKNLPPGMAEHASRGDPIGAGISDPGTTEVDDSAEPATVNEHVGPQQVGVYPHRRTFPCR